MSRGELLSILGLYQYDNSIFDELVIPDSIDKTTLINNILLECAEFEVRLTNPLILKKAIGFWSNARLKTWDVMSNVLIIDNYEPFINMDRTETRTSTENNSIGSSSNGTMENINQVSAYDTSTFQNRDKSNSQTSGSSSTNGLINRSEEFHQIGDSALYTKQNIIEQEMNIRTKYDLYNQIKKEFKKEFCLLIY